VLSADAVRLVLELQLLAAGAVHSQRQNQVPPLPPPQQQQQKQQQSTRGLVLATNRLLKVQIKAAAATSRSCLPPEVLQQAGLHLLHALAAPLQQLQLSSPGDFFHAHETADLHIFGGVLHWLVAAACGAEPVGNEENGEHDQQLAWVCESPVQVSAVRVLSGSIDHCHSAACSSRC
jgi:hypothetical protein